VIRFDQSETRMGEHRHWHTEGGVWGVQTPTEILKALQNRAKLNPIVKTVKNCWI